MKYCDYCGGILKGEVIKAHPMIESFSADSGFSSIRIDRNRVWYLHKDTCEYWMNYSNLRKNRIAVRWLVDIDRERRSHEYERLTGKGA